MSREISLIQRITYLFLPGFYKCAKNDENDSITSGKAKGTIGWGAKEFRIKHQAVCVKSFIRESLSCERVRKDWLGQVRCEADFGDRVCLRDRQ